MSDHDNTDELYDDCVGLCTRHNGYAIPAAAFYEWCVNFHILRGPDLSDLKQADEAYVGKYESAHDFAVELLDSIGDMNKVPEYLIPYFDYDYYGRDCLRDDYWASNGYYFRNR